MFILYTVHRNVLAKCIYCGRMYYCKIYDHAMQYFQSVTTEQGYWLMRSANLQQDEEVNL